MPEQRPEDATKKPSGENTGSIAELANGLAFLNLRETDAKRLRELSPTFLAHADEFVEAFYRHLFRFEDSARFLQDEQLVTRLKQSQLEHFGSMLEADWNAAFLERRRRIGQVHADVGIEPRLFLAAYGQYMEHCFRHFAEYHREDHNACIAAMLSLWKAMLLDIGLSLDSYFLRTTEDLKQALDMYWKANTELRQFAELASHDLKTPLATVANLCDEVLDEFGEQIPAEAQKMISAARSRTFRMSTMIDELLEAAVAKRDTAKDDDVSSREAVEEAVERLRPAIDEKQIEIVLPKRYPYVMGNRVKLREAIYNLLSNAVKFVDKPSSRIEIEIDDDDGDDEVVLSVTDNGPGIPEEEAERIFAPFHRLPMHRGQPGSGLGLYFTKNLIEQQGGRIWVESSPGERCSFRVALRRSGGGGR